MQPILTAALKEWAIAVEAIAQGKTVLLLRKGGIREQGGKFAVQRALVWLYPTYEHQQPGLLKPEYASQVQSVPAGWHPETVTIAAYATITHVLQISDAETIAALLPFHVWNQQFVSDRLKWKPQQPLYILLLRAYRLDSTQTISYRPEYGGCKSWIELSEPLAIAGAMPVLTDHEYSAQVNAVEQAIDSLVIGSPH